MFSPLSVTQPKIHIRPGPHFTCMDDSWAADRRPLRSSCSASTRLPEKADSALQLPANRRMSYPRGIGGENYKSRFGGKVAATSHGWSGNELDLAFLYGPGAAMEMAAAFCCSGGGCGIARLLQGVRRVCGECGSSGLCVSATSNHAGSTTGDGAQEIVNRFRPGGCCAVGAAP